jgi:hypothetical protein
MRGLSKCSRAPHRRSPEYRWFSGPRARGEIFVSGVVTLCADCVLDVLMFGVHLWFTERTGDWGVVIGNHPISVRSTGKPLFLTGLTFHYNELRFRKLYS